MFHLPLRVSMTVIFWSEEQWKKNPSNFALPPLKETLALKCINEQYLAVDIFLWSSIAKRYLPDCRHHGKGECGGGFLCPCQRGLVVLQTELSQGL